MIIRLMSEDKKNRHKIIALVQNAALFFLALLPSFVYGQQYDFRTFNSAEGLPQPYVYVVFEDRNGYLWAGTGDGLARFNGFEIKSFNTSDSLSENFVTTGYTGNRYTWFGHRGGGISFTDGKLFTKVKNPWSEAESVIHFAEDIRGKLWVGYKSRGIYQITDSEIDTLSCLAPDLSELNTFVFSGEDEIIAGTENGLILLDRKNNSAVWDQKPLEGFEGFSVCDIRKTKDGSGFLIATTSDGIYKLVKAGENYSVRKLETVSDELSGSVQGISEDNYGNIWVATFGNGLLKLVLENGRITDTEIFDRAAGFPGDNVRYVYIDRNGTIWTGNYGEGLTRISPQLFAINTYNSQFGNNINSIYSDGTIRWLGTDKGLIKSIVSTGIVVKFYSVADGLPRDTITAIYEDGDKNIWVGTEKKGLFRLLHGSEKISEYKISEGELENNITSISGRGEDIWIGTKKGVCCVNRFSDEKRWFSVSSGGLPNNSVNSIFTDGYNQVWISTNSSILSCIKEGKVSKLQFDTGSSGIYTLGPITEDEQSRIWVGSMGSGIFIIDNDTVFYLSSKENLLSDFCYSLTPDRKGHVWIGHRGGLSRVRTTDMTVRQFRGVDVFSGEYQLNHNAIEADSVNDIWIGTVNGLICYKQSAESTVPDPPVLSISSVKVNDEYADSDGNRLVLPPGAYSIRIDFIGIDLNDPDQVMYQYQMEGYDQQSEITKERSVTYRRLGDGRYRFVLKAANGDGVSTHDPLVLEILIKKPVWKKLWFYAVLIITVSFAVSYILRRRFRRLLKEKRLLEERVLERTREIQEKKNEIELQHNIIEERNTNITASIKYASNIQRAMITPSETIELLLPQSFILSRPKDIVSGDFYWVTSKEEYIVVVVADCTGHGVPGALMSMLGISLLNEIVENQGITQPDMIVTTLRERLVKSLKQERTGNAPVDGMDIAVCTIDKNRHKLYFTGGFNDLVYVQNGKMTVFKADRISVSAALQDSGTYTLNEMDISSGDMIYLFSDGYMDQFGGNFAKKFLRVHFYTTLLEVSKLPVEEQKDFLERKLKDWMKEHAQTDDITVLGIRL